MKNIKFLKQPFLFIILAILCIHFYWISQANFLVDDFGQVVYHNLTYLETVKIWIPLWGFRPVSLFVLPGIIQLLQANWIAYAVFNLSLYVFSIWVFLWIKNPFTHKQTKLFMFTLGLMPSIASTVLFSPVNQLSATLALSFAGLGLLTLDVPQKKLKFNLNLFFAYLFFAISLLTYEVALPLIFWSVFLVNHKNKIFLSKRKARNHAILLMTVIVVVITWQKFGAPNFLDTGNSRLEGFGPMAAVSVFLFFLVTLPAEILRILFLYFPINIGLTLLFFLIFKYSDNNSDLNLNKYKLNDKVLRNKIYVSILVGTSTFIFSGRVMDMNGYLNRGLTSIWILLVLLIGFIRLENKKIKSLLISLVIALNMCFFIEKISENITASHLREVIVNQIYKNEQKIELSNLETVVITDTPCTLPNGYSDIEIFCTTWDMKGALDLENLKVQEALSIWQPNYNSYLETLKGKNVFYHIYNLDQDGNITFFVRQSHQPNLNEIKSRSLFEQRDSVNPRVCKNYFKDLNFQQFIKGAVTFSSQIYECARNPF